MRYRITDEYTLVTRDRSANIYLEWREGGQPRRRSTGTDCLERAKQVARQFILEAHTIQDQPADAFPVHIILDRYLSQKDLASVDVTKRSVALWKEFLGDDMVSDLTVYRQEEFVQWLYLKGYKDGYVRRIVGVGKAALNRAWKRGEIQSVPFVELPTVGEEAYPYYASHEQLVEFLNKVPDGHLWTYCMIRLNTGCRGDAALDLTPAQVDFNLRQIRLNPTGRRQTKKYRPNVPLTRCLASYLRTLDTDPYVSWHGAKVVSIKKNWAKHAAGLPPWFHAKVLRHTVATALRQRSVPRWDVEGLLGHRKGTTEIYAKLDPDHLSAARAALDAWMVDLSRDVPRIRAHVVPTKNQLPRKKPAQGTV